MEAYNRRLEGSAGRWGRMRARAGRAGSFRCIVFCLDTKEVKADMTGELGFL